jgi:hypothetical protein
MNQPSNHPWNCDCQYCRLARGMRFIDGRWYEEGCGPPLPKRFRVAGTGEGQSPLTWSMLIWGRNGQGTTCTSDSAEEAVNDLLNPSAPDVDLAIREDGYY